MYVILDDLLEGDRFNLLLFSSDTKLYSETMTDVTKQSIFEAKKYVKQIDVEGCKIAYLFLYSDLYSES